MIQKNKKAIIKALILGIALGALMVIDGGMIFIGFIFLITIVILWKYCPDSSEATYIISIFILGFLLRMFLCAGIHIYNELSGNLYHYMGYSGNCVFGDSQATSVISQAIADIWRKQLNPIVFLTYIEVSHTIQFYIYSPFFIISLKNVNFH